MKFRFMRLGYTFGLLIQIGDKKYLPMCQLSLKDPWLIPKVDRNWCGNVVLFGWLFFYIGYHKEADKFNF